MSLFELILLGITGVLTATLTAMVGYGGGMILMAVLLQFMPPAAAIPLHGLVQLASNGWRVFLFRVHISWPLVLRYLTLLPVGVALGLWLFQGLSKEAVQTLIGLFVLSTLFTRQLKHYREKDLPTWAFYPLGFISGILNMMVGAAAILLGVLTVRKELHKEALIATLGSFALSAHIFKLIAFGLAGFPFRDYLVPALVMVPAVMVGGVTGKWLLGRMTEAAFQVAFKVILTVLGLKLFFWDGLRVLLGLG